MLERLPGAASGIPEGVRRASLVRAGRLAVPVEGTGSGPNFFAAVGVCPARF